MGLKHGDLVEAQVAQHVTLASKIARQEGHHECLGGPVLGSGAEERR